MTTEASSELEEALYTIAAFRDLASDLLAAALESSDFRKTLTDRVRAEARACRERAAEVRDKAEFDPYSGYKRIYLHEAEWRTENADCLDKAANIIEGDSQ